MQIHHTLLLKLNFDIILEIMNDRKIYILHSMFKLNKTVAYLHNSSKH